MTRTDASVAGYEARGAEARGRFDGPRVTLQRARGQAYGGRFDTRGTIGPRDPGEKGVRFDLTGRVDDIDVRRLPPPVPRLRLATDVAGTFHATLDGPQFDATMTFDDSSVEGGRVRAGSIGTLRAGARRDSLRSQGPARGPRPGTARRGARRRLAAGSTRRRSDDGRRRRAGAGPHARRPVAERARGAGPRHRCRRRRDGDDAGRADCESTARRGHRRRRRARRSGGRDDRRLGRGRRVRPRQGPRVDRRPRRARRPPRRSASTATSRSARAASPVATSPRRRCRSLLADGVLGVRRLEAATPLGAVTASGPLALNATAPSDLAYTIRGIPLAQFREQIGEVTGTVDVDGRLLGPRATLRTEGTARFAGVAAGGIAQGLEGTSPFSVALPDWDLAQVRLDVHPVLSAGAVGDMVLDTADARVGYGDDRATFDVNASSGDRRVHAAGAADLSTPGERRITLTAAGLSIGEQTWVLDAARQPTVDAAAERGAGPRRALRRRHRPDRRSRRHAGAAGAGRVQPARVGPRPRPAADRGAGRAGEPRVRRAAERGRAHHRHRGEAGRAGLVRHLARPLSRAAVRARRRRGPLRRPAPRRRRRRRAGARASRWRSTAASRWRCSRAATRTRRRRRPGRRRRGPDRPQHRELVDRPSDRHRPDDGHRAGDRDRDGEAARHRHRRQPAVRRRRDPERRRLHRAGDRTALQRSHDAHHVRAGPDEGRRPQDARRGRRCAAGQRRPRPAPAGLRRRPDARPGAALRVRPQRPGAPRSRSRSRRDRAGDAPDDRGHGGRSSRGASRWTASSRRWTATARRSGRTMASPSSARGRSPSRCRRRCRRR